MIHSILPKMIEHKLQIQQLLNIQIVTDIYYRIGFTKCNDKNYNGKINIFKKSSKT